MKGYYICVVLMVACAVYVSGESECEENRRKEEDKLRRNVLVAIVPKCEQNGDYAGLQCHHNNPRFCQCWDKDGDVLSQPSTKLKACTCLRRKKEMQKKGGHIPECQNDGNFQPKQCDGGQCWCVDKNGTTKGSPAPSSAVRCSP